MRKFYFLTVILVLLLATTIGIKAQTCTINMGHFDPAYTEQVVTIPISVYNFSNVGAFQFTVAFQKAKLELLGVTSDIVDLYSTDTVTANQNGSIVVQWNYDGHNATLLTRANGSTLMSLKFYVKSGATPGNSPITFSSTPVIVNPNAASLFFGKTDGYVNISSVLTPTIRKQVKTGATNVLQFWCQNFISYAGFVLKVNYPASSYPAITTSSISYPNATIGGSGDLYPSLATPNQIYLSWIYNGYNTATLGSNGDSVLAEINFAPGTVIDTSQFTIVTADANSQGNVEHPMTFNTTAVQTATVTAGLTTGAGVATYTGTVVTVPINVTNFNNVGAFQFEITWTNTSLELVDVARVPAFTSGDFTSTDTAKANANGKLVIAWTYSGNLNTQLNFGDGVLLNLKFAVKGTAPVPGSAVISFNQSNCLVVNPQSVSILKAGYPSSGSVTFQNKALTVFGLGTGGTTSIANSKVTIPLTVRNFIAIAGLQLDMNVPTDFTITGSDVSGSPLSSLSAGMVNGKLRIVWAFSGDPNTAATLADNDTLANLMFTYNGASTTGPVTVSFASAWTNDVNNVETNVLSATTNGTIQLSASLLVKAKVFLQGPFAGTAMNTNLTSVLPINQPYPNTAPFNHAGTESVLAGFFTTHTNIVDWVLVELRSGTAASTKVASRAAFVTSTGSIVDLDGTTQGVSFTSVAAGPYYIVIKHRNHLAVMSATPAVALPNATAYDFTVASAAYGTNPMNGTGPFLMWAGDVNKDGQLTTSDFDLWLPDAKNALTGYQITDMNMDGQVTTADFDLWLPNAKVAATSKVPQ